MPENSILKKLEFGVLEFLLALLVISGILGYFFYLPADIEWVDHIVSFLLFSYLFYQLSVTSILFGKKDKRIDLVIIISYFLLFFKDIYTFTKLIVLELEVAVLGFLDIFVMFIDDNIKILIWLIYIGTLGLLVASIFIAKNVIRAPSFLAALKSKPFKSKVLKFLAVFALLMFFYYFVYNIILEWLEFSLDDPIIVVGILFFITRLAKHKEKFKKSDFVFKIGEFAENLYKRFISLFHYKKTIPIAISGLLILHALTDLWVFAFSLITGKENFFQQLSGDLMPFFKLYVRDIISLSPLTRVSLSIDYLLNAISLIVILLIPVAAWFRIFYQKELHFKRIFLPIIYSSIAAFLLLPAYTLSETYSLEQIKTEGIVGVNILSKSLLGSSSFLDFFLDKSSVINTVALIAIIVGVLAYVLSQNDRVKTELYAISIFIGMFFFTGYIYNFSKSLLTFYYIQIIDLIFTPDFFLAIIFMILMLLSIVFYIGGFLSLIYELIMEYHDRKWSDPIDEELVKTIEKIKEVENKVVKRMRKKS